MGSEGERERRQLLREVNDRVAATDPPGHVSFEFDFLCECGDANCVAVVRMRLAEYFERREHGPIVMDGHGE
jgi:hypothetical protein